MREDLWVDDLLAENAELKAAVKELMEPAYYYYDSREDEIGEAGKRRIEEFYGLVK